MIKLLTPPLPLPYKGGERLRESRGGQGDSPPLPCRGGAGVGSDTLLICTKLFFNHYLKFNGIIR